MKTIKTIIKPNEILEFEKHGVVVRGRVAVISLFNGNGCDGEALILAEDVYTKYCRNCKEVRNKACSFCVNGQCTFVPDAEIVNFKNIGKSKKFRIVRKSWEQ